MIAGDAAAERVTALLDELRQDPDLASAVAAYEGDALKPGRKFGKNGLKTTTGKLFALFTQGTLVVKLPRKRVAELAALGLGAPFDPGHGRLMQEWLTLKGSQPPWADLVREAFAFVARR